MEVFSVTTAFPLVAIPFATSIVTVLGSPKAAPAQPRAVVGGHLISPAIAQAVRTGTVGCGAGGWCGDDCNAPDRHISPAGRNRSVGHRQQQRRHVHDPFGNRIELIEPHAR